MFIGRTDVEAETPILWPPDAKSWLICKGKCWERLRVGGEGDGRGWDGWMALLTQWTWVWVNSGSWWWTGRPGMLQSMGSQRVAHNWATELNWPSPLLSFPFAQMKMFVHWENILFSRRNSETGLALGDISKKFCCDWHEMSFLSQGWSLIFLFYLRYLIQCYTTSMHAFIHSTNIYWLTYQQTYQKPKPFAN